MGRLPTILSGRGAGVAVGLAGAAAVTGLIELLSGHVDVVSMAVCYQLAVLGVSGVYGVGAGLCTSLASAVAFNVFFLPPTGQITIADSRNWVALVVFAVTAVATSYLADGFRRQRAEAQERRRDAEALGRMAQAVLGRVGLDSDDAEIAAAAARALGVERCAIARGAGEGAHAPVALRPAAGGFTVPLVAGGRSLGLLQVGPARVGSEPRWSTPGFATAVADLAAVALERAGLVAAALESEGLRRSDVLKTALLHSVSHEFRTPLTAIRTAAHAVAEGGGVEPLSVLTAETARLDRLVANLLDLSRLEADALVARMDWCAPAEMAAGAVDASAPFLAGLSVTTDVASDLPLVRADAVLCERILVNLLHNAARHGAPPIAVEAGVSAGRLWIAVQDAGAGIDPALAPRVFDPFVAGGREGGTGVGLALARGLAEAQGAALASETAPRGARFTLSFAVAPVPQPV